MLRKNTSCEKCSLTCKSCDFYDPDREVEVYVGTTSPTVIASYVSSFGTPTVKKKGVCKLHPDPIHKPPDDWCGQHSAYRRENA